MPGRNLYLCTRHNPGWQHRKYLPPYIPTTINPFLDVVLAHHPIHATQGSAPGPQTIDLLKAALGNAVVAAQGVEYPANLLDNLHEGGCDPDDAEGMAALITQAATECPDAQLVVSGFSQGAAMVHRSVEQLETAVAARIVAGVTYGDTQREQDDGLIPGLDAERTHIICHDGDLVCEGTLIVTDAHDGYENEAPEAVEFIVGRL